MRLRTVESLGFCFATLTVGALTTIACESDHDSATTTSDASTPDGSLTDTGVGADAEACVPGALPPTGISQVASGADVGKHVSMVLDDGGAPVIAYQTDKGTNDASAVSVNVVRWDPATCSWRAPLVIDTFGSQTDNGRQIQLAIDRSSGTIGVAYQAIVGTFGVDHHYEVRYAELKKGAAAFSTPARVEDAKDDDHAPASPGLGLSNGKVFVAYREPYRLCNTSGCEAMVYRVRDAAGTWSGESEIPLGGAVDGNSSVAIDSDGDAALAWIESRSADSGGVTMKARFLRLATDVDASVASSSVIFQNEDTTGTDAPWIEIAFDGKKPRAVVILNQNADGLAAGKTEWFVASDDGVTWKAPVALPHDHGSSLDLQASIAIGSGGAIVIASNSNASDGTHVFGTPKILTSTDGTTFAVGGPARDLYENGADWASAKVGTDGKVQVAMHGHASSDPTKQGLIYFHAP